jgi:hypothetical protein
MSSVTSQPTALAASAAAAIDHQFVDALTVIPSSCTAIAVAAG